MVDYNKPGTEVVLGEPRAVNVYTTPGRSPSQGVKLPESGVLFPIHYLYQSPLYNSEQTSAPRIKGNRRLS